MTFTMIAPFEIFAVLQRLDLLPSWPFFPSLMALIPFTLGSPIQVQGVARTSNVSYSKSLMTSLALSPLSLWWLLFYAKTHIDQKFYTYMRIVLPKPDFPDIFSWKGAREDGLDNDAIPGLGSTKDPDGYVYYKPLTLIGALKNDILPLTSFFEKIWSWYKMKAEGKTKDEDKGDLGELPPVQTTNVSNAGVPINPQDPASSLGQDTIIHEQVPPQTDLLIPAVPPSHLQENTSQSSHIIPIEHLTSHDDSPSVPIQSSFAQQELNNSDPLGPSSTANPTTSNTTRPPTGASNNRPEETLDIAEDASLSGSGQLNITSDLTFSCK